MLLITKLSCRPFKMISLTYRVFIVVSHNSARTCRPSLKINSMNTFHIIKCNFSVNYLLRGTAGHGETISTTQGLSKLQAQELVLRLTVEERTLLSSALQEYQSKLVKDEYEGKIK